MEFNKVETCELYFRDVSSKTPKGKTILRNLNGNFNGGSLIAIMGNSGSGKTTLLNILSGYNSQNATCDTIEINGIPTDFKHMSKISCYLTQDIHLNDLLTVEENMEFTVDFKLGVSHSQTEKNTIIEELLETFGLSSIKSTRAGKLSGGERKRLAIALEIIHDPKIICLDEPTTGLDISTTHQILTYLKKIASSGKTVICTIHQVCASHFELFDLAYVIAEGQCAYQGRPQDLVPFLDEHGLPCNILHNPVDYLSELCFGDYGKDKAGYLVQASQNGNTYIQQNPRSKKSSTKIKNFVCSNTSWKYQYKTLVRREIIKLRRNVFFVPVRLIGSNLIALCFALLFWNIGNDATKVLTIYKFALGMLANIILTVVLCPVLSFPTQMQIVKREVFNNYYTVFQYYTSVLVIDLPILIVAVSTSSMSAWYLTGQPLDMERILIFQLFIITFGCVCNLIGFFVGCLDISLNAAICLVMVTQLPLLVISGLGLYFQDMNWLIEHFGRIIYIRTAFQGCLVSLFGLSRRKMECPVEFCVYKEPHRLLVDIGVDPYNYVMYWYNLISWICVVVVLTYICMKHRLSR